ncbi:MAG: TIGR00730 family Rossman fold protein [Bacteriovoracaceae bacterium]|nr:TIGR00730 family Rossman fold protein [Bacteriovoracaceae bacterium]
MKKNIAVFCGARLGVRHSRRESAEELMQAFHKEGWGLVYGGGKVGIMGVLADEMLRLGGEVVGVIPRRLMEWEVGHTGLKDLRIVEDMHTRKRMMYESSDAFVILPGGIGTMDEFFEILTWKQLGEHKKPIILFNHEAYYDGLLQWFSRAVEEGYYTQDQMELFHVETTQNGLTQFLKESWK